MALTKAELTDHLVDKLNFNKKDAKEYVEAFFDEIVKGLLADGVVKLSGFGNFATRDKPSRPGRNPKTGEYVKIDARRVVTFKTGQKLKSTIESTATAESVEKEDDHAGL